jgi:hypothetical protein
MHSPDLEAAFEEGILDTEIALDGRERLLAVDRVGSFGAAFLLTLKANGDWSADAAECGISGNGWTYFGSAGVHGGPWDPTWAPQEDEWEWQGKKTLLWTFVTAGMDAEDSDGKLIMLRAISGFAAAKVSQVRLDVLGADPRLLTVNRPLGAFACLATGPVGLPLKFAIVALDSTGAVLEERHFDVN